MEDLNVTRGASWKTATKADLRLLEAKLIAQFGDHDGRLGDVEETAPRLVVVATEGDLPADAEPQEMFRVTGTTTLYVGDGTGNPLLQVATTPFSPE